MNTLQYIYKQEDEANVGYSMPRGRIIVELNDVDSFEVMGEPIIFGVHELLLSESNGPCNRLFSVKTDATSKYFKIPINVIKSQINQFDTGYRIGKTLAEILIKLDDIFINKMDQYGKYEHLSKSYCKIFSWAVDTLGDFYDEKKYNWLEELYTTYTSSITYAKGKAMDSMLSKITLSKSEKIFQQLNSNSINFAAGSIICKEGDPGDELFILKEGKIKVFIKDYLISIIEKPGTILGDMIFWLGGNRTATMKAITDTTMVFIKKTDIEKILNKSPDFLKNLIIHLSRRVMHLCITIDKLNKDISGGKTSEEKEKEDLKALKNSLTQLTLKHNDFDWLYNLLTELTEKMSE
ncbi:MAG: cyclic nucleotide-binding domain-containing protein, partial [Spirochaetota bacterium]|nr:cyclic nucleotide-binding domain-containing protein [Spirochaetota bacterium]